MLNSKKGDMQMSMIILIVLGIITFFLIAAAITKAYGGLKGKEAEQLCRNSIGMRANLAINVGNDLTKLRIYPVLCKTQDKEIKGNRKTLKRELAQLSSRCWWMFHEGELEEIFDTITSETPLETNKCFICNTVGIDQKEIDDAGPIDEAELFDYFVDTKHNLYSSYTYLTYIQNFKGPGSLVVLDQIEGARTYGIAFMSKEEGQGVDAGTIAASRDHQAIQNLKNEFYENDNRETSVIVIDNINDIRASGCAEGDIAGQ